MGVDRTGSDRGTAGRRLAHGGGLLAALTLLAMAAAPRPAPAAEPAPAAAGMTTVISAGSLWRKHYSFAPPRLSVAAAQALGLKPDPVSRAQALTVAEGRIPLAKFYLRYVIPLETPPPPANWTAADFDDSGWIHAPGLEFAANFIAEDTFRQPPPPDGSRLPYVRGADPGVWEMQLVCMRGRFLVKDRAAVKKLRFSIVYRGGFIARLNGAEIARGALPPGVVAAGAAAEDYPANASLTYPAAPGGSLRADTRPENQQYWPLRERRVGPVDVDPALLRDGLNLLTIEIHRSDYPAECREIRLGFAPVGLSELFLEAAAPAGNFVGSTWPPAGLRVWNAETWETILTSDFGDAAEPLGPMVIVAARNGSFSGQVVVGSTAPIVGLQAKVDALKKKGGGGEIPSASWRMRYGAVNPTHETAEFRLATCLRAQRFDMLLDAPPWPPAGEPARMAPAAAATIAGWSEQIRKSLGLPEKATNTAVVPIWVAVQVPRDAVAGDYEGSLTITAQGATPLTVPLRLHVADWTLPDVRDYASVMFIYQSPDTLAEYYKVKLWSPEHWRLIEHSLALLGEAGNVGLILPLLAESQHGNAESLVLWIKKADGTYDYDFTRFDKYVETALKHHDPKRLKAVELDVWGYQAEAKGAGALVTLLNPGTGAKSNMKLPAYGTAECEALWRPVLLAARERLRKAGVADKIMLGICCDPLPDPSHVAMFRNILSDTPWLREAHHPAATIPYDPRNRKNVVPIGLTSIVYGHLIEYGPIPDPSRRRIYGWNRPGGGGRMYNETRSESGRFPDPIMLSLNRAQAATLSLGGFGDPWQHHMLMESSLVGGFAGFGRCGGDYFRFRQGGGTLFLRYPAASGDAWNKSLNWTTPDMLAPGTGGAVTTVRWENTRAGIQESEARIFLEKALLNTGRPVPADLAKRCQDLLDARTRAMQMGHLNWTWERATRGDTPFGSYGWQESNRRLFDLAADVSRVTAR